MRLIWQRRYLFRSRGARNNHRVAQNPLIRIEEDKLYYSEDIIEEVRSRNDIVDVIGGVAVAELTWFVSCRTNGWKIYRNLVRKAGGENGK